MSDIRFNQWLHQSGTGGVSQDHIGNIGIGTTNPSIVVSAANTAVLNVGVITANNLFVNNAFNGDITGNVTGNISGATGTFSGNVDIADKIIHTGDTDTAMRFPADNTFAVDTAGSERLRITSDGQIGMGIASPTQESGTGLHIRGANGGQTRIHLTNSDTGDTATDGFYIISQGAESGGASGEVMLQQKENKALKFATNNTERLRITSGGLVGVNCTPLAQFQVKAGTNQNIALSSMSSEAAIEAFNDAGSANVSLRLRGSDFKFFTGSTEKLRITSDGRVCIDATSPVVIGGQTPNLYVNYYTNLDGLRIRGLDTGNTIWKDGGDMSLTVASAHSIYLKTQSATGLQVNADGQVATPLQPRFFARRSANYTGYNGQNTGGTWIAYDVLDYNIGGGFQTSGSDQGLFVAPVSGLYLFHAAAYKGTGTADWTQSWFNVNSSRANGTDFVHSSGTRFAQNAIQVYMTAGQKIGFHPYNNQTNNEIRSTGNHTWFKGCLLG